MMRIFNRQPKVPSAPPKPKPEISAPLPGSGRSITGPGSEGRPVPPNPNPPAWSLPPRDEYPHNKAVPNSFLTHGENGKLNLHHLPPGARPASSTPMPDNHQAPIPKGWPANNHFTDKYNSLRDRERDAHHLYQSAPKPEKREAKKEYNQARRETLVFKQRNSRPLGIEADFRQAEGRRIRAENRAETQAMAAAQVPEAPQVPVRTPVTSTHFPKASKAPGLDTIREFPDLLFPAGTTVSQPLAPARPTGPSSTPHIDKFQDLRTRYHEAQMEHETAKPENRKEAKEKMLNAQAEMDIYRKRFDRRMKDEAVQQAKQDKLEGAGSSAMNTLSTTSGSAAVDHRPVVYSSEPPEPGSSELKPRTDMRPPGRHSLKTESPLDMGRMHPARPDAQSSSHRPHYDMTETELQAARRRANFQDPALEMENKLRDDNLEIHIA